MTVPPEQNPPPNDPQRYGQQGPPQYGQSPQQPPSQGGAPQGQSPYGQQNQPPQGSGPGNVNVNVTQQVGTQSADQAKGFLMALLDWRFHTLVTPKIVSWIYLACIVVAVLTWLGWIVTGFAGDYPIIGVLALLFGWVLALIWLAFVRMTLEVYFALVRMSDDVHRTFAARPGGGQQQGYGPQP